MKYFSPANYQPEATMFLPKSRDTNGLNPRVQYTGNTDLHHDGNGGPHRNVQVILVSSDIGSAIGNQSDQRKGKRLSLNRILAPSIWAEIMWTTYIDYGFEIPEDRRDGHSYAKLGKNSMFANDNIQKQLVNAYELVSNKIKNVTYTAKDSYLLLPRLRR